MPGDRPYLGGLPYRWGSGGGGVGGGGGEDVGVGGEGAPGDGQRSWVTGDHLGTAPFFLLLFLVFFIAYLQISLIFQI